jgi:DNA-binding MarR family transcriptional regulator
MRNVATNRAESRTQVQRRQRSNVAGSAGPEVRAKTEEVRRRARRLDALVRELNRGSAASVLQLEILRHLDQYGPRLVREIPRAWPVTRQHVRSLAERLVADGLLAFVGNGDPATPRRLGLTEEGRRVLEEIDWNETIRLVEEEDAG